MATGDPTGADVASGTTNGNTLPTGPTTEDREITFSSPYALLSGKKYAIVVRGLSMTVEVPIPDILWLWGSFGSSYAGGKKAESNDSGGTWTQSNTWDHWFTTKAAGISKDSQTTGADLTELIVGDPTNWTAQTFTTTSAYSISSVVLRMSKDTTPGTITVSLRKVEGETYVIPFTPPVPTGENNILTVRRLVAVANDKFWYESI